MTVTPSCSTSSPSTASPPPELSRVTDQAVTGTDGLRAYIYVADVDDTLTVITARGGRVVTPPYPEGTLRVALFADQAGNVLGIWQEASGSQAQL